MLVPVQALGLRAGWTFSWHAMPFNLTTPCPFQTYSVVSSSPYTLRDLVQTSTTLQGIFTGTWFGPVQASITCYARSHLVHEGRILGLRRQKDVLRGELVRQEARLATLKRNMKIGEEDLKLLWELVDELRRQSTRIGERTVDIHDTKNFESYLLSRDPESF